MSKAFGNIDPSGSYYLGNLIHTELVNHIAWDHVEDLDYSDGLNYRVYKCLGSANTFGQDFFVCMIYPLAVGDNSATITFRASEEYNVTTKELTNWVRPNGSLTSLTIQADGTWDYSTYKSVARYWNDSSFVGNKTLDVSTLTSDYYISVTNNRFIVGTSSNSIYQHLVYAGLYESFVHPTRSALTFPLVLSNSQGTGYNTGAILSRWPSPKAISEGYSNRELALVDEIGKSTGRWNYIPWYLNRYGDTDYDDLMYGALPTKSALYQSQLTATYGRLAGLYYDILNINADASAIQMGDTFTYLGDTYDVVSIYAAGNMVYLLKDNLD